MSMTGKRDLGGMLNDGMNSLTRFVHLSISDANGNDLFRFHRMYSSTFSDWFTQAVIDFMLGY